MQQHSVRLGARSSKWQRRRSGNSEVCAESVIQNYKASSPLGQKHQQRVAKTTVEEDSEKSFPCDSTQKSTKCDPATSRNKFMQFINDPGKAKYFIHTLDAMMLLDCKRRNVAYLEFAVVDCQAVVAVAAVVASEDLGSCLKLKQWHPSKIDKIW